MTLLPNQTHTAMYSDKHIIILLDALAQANDTITELRTQLDSAVQESHRNWDWYKEEREKVRALEAKSTENPVI